MHTLIINKTRLTLLKNVCAILIIASYCTYTISSDNKLNIDTSPQPFQEYKKRRLYHLSDLPKQEQAQFTKLVKNSSNPKATFSYDPNYNGLNICTIDFNKNNKVINLSSKIILGPDIAMPENGLLLSAPKVKPLQSLFVVKHEQYIGKDDSYSKYYSFFKFKHTLKNHADTLVKEIQKSIKGEISEISIYSFYCSNNIIKAIKSLQQKFSRADIYTYAFGYAINNEDGYKSYYLPSEVTCWNTKSNKYQTNDNKNIGAIYYNINLKNENVIISNQPVQRTDMVVSTYNVEGILVKLMIYSRAHDLAIRKIADITNKQAIKQPVNAGKPDISFCRIRTYYEHESITVIPSRPNFYFTSGIVECIVIIVHNHHNNKLSMFHKTTIDPMYKLNKNLSHTLELNNIKNNYTIIITTEHISSHLKKVIDYLHKKGLKATYIDLSHNNIYLNIENSNRIFRFCLTEDALKDNKLKPFKEWAPKEGWQSKTALVSHPDFQYYVNAQLVKQPFVINS